MIDKSYVKVVESIKEQIRVAQHKAILNANKEMIILYWNIGKVINLYARQIEQKKGSNFSTKLSSPQSELALETMKDS